MPAMPAAASTKQVKDGVEEEGWKTTARKRKSTGDGKGKSSAPKKSCKTKPSVKAEDDNTPYDNVSTSSGDGNVASSSAKHSEADIDEPGYDTRSEAADSDEKERDETIEVAAAATTVKVVTTVAASSTSPKPAAPSTATAQKSPVRKREISPIVYDEDEEDATTSDEEEDEETSSSEESDDEEEEDDDDDDSDEDSDEDGSGEEEDTEASENGEKEKKKHSRASPKSKKMGKDYQSKLSHLFKDCRFFLIKSGNYENVSIAKSQNVWSTLPMNERKLNNAVKGSTSTIVIYSVKESGKFQGYARIVGEADRDVDPPKWVLPPTLSARQLLGGVFRLEWINRHELSFSKTVHLRNRLNENLLVKIGRDGQEIDAACAEALCRLFPPDLHVNIDMLSERARKRYVHTKGQPSFASRKPQEQPTALSQRLPRLRTPPSRPPSRPPPRAVVQRAPQRAPPRGTTSEAPFVTRRRRYESPPPMSPFRAKRSYRPDIRDRVPPHTFSRRAAAERNGRGFGDMRARGRGRSSFLSQAPPMARRDHRQPPSAPHNRDYEEYLRRFGESYSARRRSPAFTTSTTSSGSGSYGYPPPPAWQSYESRRSYPSPPPPPGVGPSNTSSSRSHRPDGVRTYDEQVAAFIASQGGPPRRDSQMPRRDRSYSPPTRPPQAASRRPPTSSRGSYRR